MKIKFLFVLCLLVSGLTGCNKTDGPGNGTGETELIVKLPDDYIPSSRGVEDPIAPGSKTTIDNARVYLMSGSAVVLTDVFTQQDFTNGYKRFDQVSSAINRVVVMANQRGKETELGELTAYSEIEKFPFTVASQNDVAGISGSKTLLGEAEPKDPAVPEDPPVKEAVVTVNTITSRFEVGDVSPGEGVEEVELVASYINNYFANGSRARPLILHPEGHDVWKTTPAAGVPSDDPTAFDNARIDNAYTEQYYRQDADYTQVDWDDPTKNKCYAYHLFTGEYIPHLIVLVKGKYKDTHAPEGKEYFFGWVTFTKFTYLENSEKKSVGQMEANKIYKMGLTDGIKINAKDITDQPEKNKMDVSITVEVAPWTDQEVNPEV